MRLTLEKNYEDIVRRDLKKGDRCKFVLIQGKGESVLHVFTDCIEHISAALSLLSKHGGYRFTGAGHVGVSHLQWNSVSCLDHFGYYKPEKKTEGDRLLQEISDTTRHLIHLNKL